MSRDPRPKCNRCGVKLKPGEATRDRDKAGYVHKDDCPPKPAPGQKVMD